MRRTPAETLVIAVIATIFAVTIVFGVHECKRKQRCEDGGGKVEKYNCQWVLMTCGDGCFYPVEVCAWRCVGGSAEARP